MGKTIFKILALATAVTMATTLTAAVIRNRKAGYIRPLKLTYSFIYE